MKTGVRLFLASDGTTIFGKIKEEILKEITGTYGNTRQTAADTQTGRENPEDPDVGNGLSPDDAGNRGTDTGGRGGKGGRSIEQERVDLYRSTVKESKGLNTGSYDSQGNPVDSNGKLVIDRLEDLNELTNEDFITPTRNVELPQLQQNISNAIGADSKPIIIKKNIFEKNRIAHPELTPEQSRDILKKSLYITTFIGRTQPIKRPNYWIAVQTADKNSITVLEVNKGKDNVEIVGWRRIDAKGIEKLKRQAEREGGQFLILTSKDAAAALSALPFVMSFNSKDSKESPDIQEADNKNSNLSIHESQQKQTGIPYRQSNELDENGRPFVLASDGTTIFGEIGADSGLPPAPIKLSRGIQDENGKGYGLLHIEANHGEQIRKAGFSSVNDFVPFIAHNYDKDNIRVGKRRHNGNITYLLQVTDSHDNTLFIEMSRDGAYWNVNSAGVFRKRYSQEKKTVWSASEVQNQQSVADDTLRAQGNPDTNIAPNGTVSQMVHAKDSKESPDIQEADNKNSNLSENEVRNATSPSGGDSNLSDTEERYRESGEPVSPETLAKDRAELEEIFGKSFFPNVSETVKKRTAERMSAVSKAAKEFKAELKNAPEIILISDINDILKYDTQAKTIDDVYRRMTVKGWYSPGNGKVYVNLASHLTPEDVKATILHEAVGHSGLRRLLGKDAFTRLCNTVYQSLPEDIRKKKLEEARETHPGATDEQLHLIVGDEYMATLAEGGAEQSIPQRIISAVRDFLRSIGIDLEINEADLRYLLHASYKNIKDADAVTVVNNSALLARLRKAAEETHIKSEAESLFRLGKKSRDAYERLLEEKRPDMPEAMRKEALDYLDSLEDSKANTKKIKIAVKWLADGTIRLPEDADKVDMAIEYANRKGIDAMQYNSPLDLIDALKGHVEIKDKPIDPDTVKELTNKVEYGDGLTVYEVENSEAGRQAMRRIINTHFGKDASPWCLLQGDSEGNLTKQSAQYWQHYNAYPKRVAFKDGKLLAFFANDEDTPVWWDRLDRPNYNGIPVTGKIKGDPLGRTATRMFDENTKTYGQPLDIHKGNKQNGTYEAWHPNGQMRVRAHYKNGIPVGIYESWYENGNPLVKTYHNEKGEYDGLYEDWYENGQPHSRSNFKGDMVDGLSEDWYEDGQLKERCNYKDGNLDGLRELWYDDGQPLLRENYKDDKKDGLYEKWNFDGEQISKELYENGVLKAFLPLDNSTGEVRFRMDNDLEAEEQAIINRAKSDDTYMKAPNGEPTKLTPKQWVQVRTRAFIEWFGDWEKAARIEKLRQSEPAEITGKEVTPSDDLKQYKKNALEYGKNLRSEYTNKDTGETISLTAGNSRGGIREILQHDYKDVEHLQSIAAIPHIIENSIFIDEQPNEDLERYPGVKSFSYYVCGLKIGGVDYTVKAVIANQNNGERYYDHKLTNIEKGELLSIVPTIQKAGIDSKTPYIGVKDKRLLSLLQTNSSKVVDENGEPRVIDGLYLNIKERNPITRLDISINKANNYVNKISEIENETGMEWDNESIFYQEEKAYNLLESIVSQKDYIEILINSIRKGIIPSIVVAYRYGDINERERSYNYRDQIFEQGISVVGRVSELNTNIDKYYELFYGEQPYNIVVGVYSGNRGGDGEILLTPATKLGLVENLGNIIKSATDNTGSFSSENADIRFRMDNDLEAVNKRFNEELERYQQGKMSKNEMFHLGLPNGVMSIFLPNLPIVMRQRVVNKGANKKHNVEVSSIINMPQKISEPIFVFKKDDKSLSILSEMKDKIGRNVFVAFDLSSEIQDGGRYIEVNDVTTVHGRRIENIIRPINENNSLQWVDKKKALEWFSSASPNVQQEITSQELKTASNIIKTFENPNFETEKNTEDIRFRMDNEAHQKSFAVTLQLIENAIFIDELPNEKGNGKCDSYRYYMCGLKIGGVDYTVKVTIGVKQGKRYYDHGLTEIEKGNLYEIANGFTTTGGAPVPSSAEYKDRRLVSILQADASKVVDENGEPRVVYHGTNESFLSFDRNKAGISRNTCERPGRIGRNIWQKFFPERIRDSQKADGRKNGRINNLENKKSYSHRRKTNKNDAYFGFEQNFQHQR